MNPNAMAAPNFKPRLMNDVVPPPKLSPITDQNIPVVRQAAQAPAPAEHPISGQPPQTHAQNVATVPAQTHAKPAPNHHSQPDERAAHQPKSAVPVVAITLAMLVMAGLVVAAFMTYRQG